MRIICRQERPSTGAQLSLFEEIPQTWPWARELQARFLAAFALIPP
jgi:hypothetical protein